MVSRSPTQRIADLASAQSALRDLAVRVLGEYAWFLETLSRDKASSIKWLSRGSNVAKADRHAQCYRDGFVELLEAVGREGQLLRYILM